MDRKWMSSNRLSKRYKDGVKEFIRFAVEHADDPTKIICPCLKCCYGKLISATELEDHLICHGIDRSYTLWTKHGETNDESSDWGYSGGCASNDFDTRVQKEIEKHRRGLTVLKEVTRAKESGQRIHVQWNHRGHPIKANGKKLNSYIGIAVKMKVPISHKDWKDWRKVPEPLKDLVFQDIVIGFDIDESHRRYVYQKAGVSLRSFRYILAKRFMRDQEGNILEHPPRLFELYIKQEDWDAFTGRRRKESFQILSQQNSESAKSQQYPYRAGRLGYSGLEDKLLTQEGSQRSSLTRHELWTEARKNKEGIFDNENVRGVCKKIDALSQSMAQASEEGSGLDVLSKALGLPEHPGRVRGAGFGITKRAYFGTQCRSTLNSSAKVAELEAIVQQQSESHSHLERVVAQLTELVHKQAEQLQQIQLLQRTQVVIANSNMKDKCSLPSHHFLEGELYCQLWLDSPTRRVVAEGRVHNTRVDMIHKAPLLADHLKVFVDIPKEENTKLPIPIQDMDTVGKAVGSFVAWPTNLITITSSGQSKGKRVLGTGQSKESIVAPATGLPEPEVSEKGHSIHKVGRRSSRKRSCADRRS